MRRTAKMAVAGLVVAVAVGFFFLAPVSFWYTEHGGPVGTSGVSVFRSLGGATVGFGDIHSPEWFGFSFGCSIPVPLPL